MSGQLFHPSAWTADQFRAKGLRIFNLRSRHLRVLEMAARLSWEELSVERNPLRTEWIGEIENDILAWRHEVEDAAGVVCIRGFPIEYLDQVSLGKMFFAVSTCFGKPLPQSGCGDYIGIVENTHGSDPRSRAYKNNLALNMHTDRCDVIGMLWIRNAATGGETKLASSLAVYDHIRRSNPRALRHLRVGFPMHRFSDRSIPGKVLTDRPVPIFSNVGATPTVVYLRAYIKLAVDEGYYRISSVEAESLDLFDAAANSQKYQVSWLPKPGDGLFINNCTLLHGRTAFEDHGDGSSGRLLIRTWLANPTRPAVDAVREYKESFSVDSKQEGSYYQGPGYSLDLPLDKWY
jgi:hypothetical protein